MTPDRWQQISVIYNAAAMRTGADRDAYLQQACSGDEELRRDVESLLGKGGSFLNTPLPAGSRLGSYELLSVVGAGGMGIVFRARDARLQRDVAIKVLPEPFALDADRVARFKREAQVLASLNDPHIAAIYGFEEAAGVHALVLELVEGPTLADRIAQGAIPLEEALPIARQIAEALEVAHEHGIIHRDLKPANIKVRDDGTVKVLDFGLAKLTEAGEAGRGAVGADLQVGPRITQSPTVTSPALVTGAGVLLGTAAYMSPEQAKGKVADKRSDIWAFGCVLFEILTRRRAFECDDVVDTLAAVLRGEPAWDALPADVPPHLRTIVKGCLEKDRKVRIPDISAVRFLIDHSGTLATAPSVDAVADSGARRTRSAIRTWQAVAAFLALATVAGATGWWSASRPIVPSVTRFFVYPPEKTTFVTAGRPGTSVVISPDGSKLAFTARDTSGKLLVWIRPIDSLTAQPLPGTDNAAYPFWSPDSRFIAYFAPQKLLKIAATGGPPQALCDTYIGTLNTPVNQGGTWSQDGMIVFNMGPGRPLSRVSSGGGQPSEFMRLAEGQTSQAFPSFLPDGRHFLFYADAKSADVAGVYVGSLDAADSKRLTAADSAAIYDSHSGHLLFVRQSTLLAQSFNPTTLALTGEPVPIAERVEGGDLPGNLTFSASRNGILAYGVSAGTAAGLQLAFFDRKGKQVQAIASPGNYRGIDLAPDGRRVVTHRHDGNGGDIWVIDVSRGTPSRFTFDASQENSTPIWSPDGARIVYASVRNGKSGMYQKLANNSGIEDLLVQSDDATMIPMSWSPDGRFIVYEVIDPKTSNDLWVLPLSGDRKPFPLLHASFNETHGQISPDGKWLAYYSNETGRVEVFVQPFPNGAGKWQVSTNGGWFPRWRGDGRELFYMTQPSGGKMIGVDVGSSGFTFEAGSPKELFDSPYINLVHSGTGPGAGPYHAFSVSADGQRFLIPHPPSSDASSQAMPIAVVTNWAVGLGK